jgi:hypothetical protein
VGPSLGVPHWEHLTETADAMEKFWAAQG